MFIMTICIIVSKKVAMSQVFDISGQSDRWCNADHCIDSVVFLTFMSQIQENQTLGKLQSTGTDLKIGHNTDAKRSDNSYHQASFVDQLLSPDAAAAVRIGFDPLPLNMAVVHSYLFVPQVHTPGSCQHGEQIWKLAVQGILTVHKRDKLCSSKALNKI